MDAETSKLRYPTKAKVQFAVAMAREAGITDIGSIQIGGDGSIRVFAKGDNIDSVESEIERWKAARGRK